MLAASVPAESECLGARAAYQAILASSWLPSKAESPPKWFSLFLPRQTTDWFTSIQRCFQWSERVEQLPMDQVGFKLGQCSANKTIGAGCYRDEQLLPMDQVGCPLQLMPCK